VIKTKKIEISFFFMFFIYIIYIKFTILISIWGYGTLRTDLFKSSILIYSQSSSPLHSLSLLLRSLKIICLLFVILSPKWEKRSRSSRILFEFDISLFGIRKGEIEGWLSLKTIRERWIRCQQSAISFAR